MVQRLQEYLYRLLRWSEKYTKTDMVYLASGGFWSLVGQAGASVSALVLSIFLSRYLTQTDYGNYKYVLSVVAILGVFSLSGLATSVFQSAARGFDSTLIEGFWMDLWWSFAIFAGGFLIGGYYLLHGNLVIGVGILVGGCLSPLISATGLFTQFLGGKKDFKRQSLYTAVWGTLLPGAALIATAVVTHSALWVVVMYFISNTAVGLYFYWCTLRHYRPDAAHRDPSFLSYSKHMSLIGVLTGIAGNIDNLLVFHFVGAPALAVYTFATGIVDQSKGPLKSLDTMTQARFATGKTAHIAESMGSKMWWLLLLSVLFVAIYIPLAPFIYHLLFPAYMNAVPYSQIYALAMLTLPLTPASSYLSAKRLVREQYISSIANNVLQILLLTGGIIFWGLWGLIIARVVGRFVTYGVMYVLYRSAAHQGVA